MKLCCHTDSCLLFDAGEREVLNSCYAVCGLSPTTFGGGLADLNTIHPQYVSILFTDVRPCVEARSDSNLMTDNAF